MSPLPLFDSTHPLRESPRTLVPADIYTLSLSLLLSPAAFHLSLSYHPTPLNSTTNLLLLLLSFPFCRFSTPLLRPCNSPSSVFLSKTEASLSSSSRPSATHQIGLSLSVSRLISMKPHSIWPIKEGRERFLGTPPSLPPMLVSPKKKENRDTGRAGGGFGRY